MSASCQLPLFGSDIEARFERFHRANPHIYEMLRDGALELRRAGWKHYGIKALYEGLRFERSLRTTTDDFKLNNNYTALYARKLMEEVPKLRGFFETRSRRA